VLPTLNGDPETCGSSTFGAAQTRLDSIHDIYIIVTFAIDFLKNTLDLNVLMISLTPKVWRVNMQNTLMEIVLYHV
jgi:hypothetical protein